VTVTIKQELVTFIETHLVGDDLGAPLTDDTDLIESGIVDSMGLMRIVTFLEDRAGVRVPDDEVAPDNFATIAAITALTERLRARKG
jgi:acyl carrier protein